MSRVKDGNYITIQSWMVTDLHLKGNELLIYAIVHGFSQDGESRFSGSLQYLADWTNSSRQTVWNNLQSLCEKGLLEKFDIEKRGVKFCEYRSKFLGGVQKNCTPVQNSCTGGVQNSCTGGVQKNCTNTPSIDKDIIYNIGNKAPGPAPAPPGLLAYGECRNVFLTEDEYNHLRSAFPGHFERTLNNFSRHLKKTGIQYESVKLRLIGWLTDDALKRGGM